MFSTPGTEANPLRVAIIGSGPAGFYAADYLLKAEGLVAEVDMFDRLPTPHGLVRGGVAPDHAKIKSVSKVYDKTASHPRFRFYGNVEFGNNLTHDDLVCYYHAIIYATGAQTDRRMGIPGEDLIGSYAATEFVGWYNAHPDFRDLQFDLSQERVAVVGNGNVAMDVARILARTYDELKQTDIADYALEALGKSQVREIYVLGRRGPAQAAFTNPEIKELGELEDAEVIVRPDEAELDSLSREWLINANDRTAENNVQIIQRYAQNGLHGDKTRRIHMRFLVSPVEITGNGHVDAIKLVKNALEQREDGSLRPRPTDTRELLPVELVFRSIGYQGVPLLGVPFDERNAVIPNDRGRVLDPNSKTPIPGEYAVGWIKRGPTGVIGTNKPDAHETVLLLIEDVQTGKLLQPATPTREALERLLYEHRVNYVTYEDWQTLDQLEQERGQSQGRPRVKVSRIRDMLDAIAERKRQSIIDPTHLFR